MNNKDKLPIGAEYLTNKERDERTKIKTGNQKKINNHTNKYTNKKKERKSTIYHINNSLFYEDDIKHEIYLKNNTYIPLLLKFAVKSHILKL